MLPCVPQEIAEEREGRREGEGELVGSGKYFLKSRRLLNTLLVLLPRSVFTGPWGGAVIMLLLHSSMHVNIHLVTAKHKGHDIGFCNMCVCVCVCVRVQECSLTSVSKLHRIQTHTRPGKQEGPCGHQLRQNKLGTVIITTTHKKHC